MKNIDYKAKLRNYFLYEHPEVIVKDKAKSWLIFGKSSTSVYVNASKTHKNNNGWYDLDESIYKEITNNNAFCAFILNEPQITFVIPKQKIHDIFNDVPLLNGNNRSARWMFSIMKENNHYYLKMKDKKEDLSNYLNNWLQIDDFNGDIRFFLIQVNDKGSTNILNNLSYEHMDWKDHKRDFPHGKVNPGDILLVYFGGNSIKYKKQLRKIYRVESVSDNNIRFELSELLNLKGISYDCIKKGVRQKQLNDNFTNLGLQGFNIIQLSSSDYKSILLLDSNLNSSKDWIETYSVENDEKMNKNTLTNYNTEESILEFDKNRDLFGPRKISFEEIMRIRGKFVSDFTIDKIRIMNMDQYVLGKKDETGKKNDSTFCYRLEYSIPGFGGISGTPAEKFGLYYKEDEEKFKYNIKYKSPEEAFQEIKKEIITILEAGERFSKDSDSVRLSSILEENEYEIKRHVISRILTIYFPERFVAIHSNDLARKILQYLFNIPEEEIPDKFFLKQAKLLEIKNSHQLMKNWTTYDFSRFIWYSSKKIKSSNLTESKFQENEIEEIILVTLDDVAKNTYFPKESLENIEILLNQKRQIILYGPPGTGKTYVAKKFSEYFTKDKENVEIIQFHQSYSYEDFVEGIRPQISESGISEGFVKQPGIFKKMVKKAIESSDKKFVLIIDEINRGNISRIFGELIYLLEYRKESITLTYSPNEKFSIPKNLFIIGTMNTADRSIAFVDYALRRRFYFVKFDPLKNNVLQKWFEVEKINKEYKTAVLNILNYINEKIGKELGEDYQIGYSYFMIKDGDNEKLKRILDYAIVPLLEQYYFGNKEKVDEINNNCCIFLDMKTQNTNSIEN